MGSSLFRFRRTVLAQLLIVAAAVAAAAQSPVSQPRIVLGEINGKSVAAQLPYKVLLPVDYYKSERRYPVLYLLHGLRGHYTDWLSKTNLAEYAEKYELIIVTPEGNDAWYSNSVVDANQKYEDYIIKELIPEIDSHFRTISDRHGRAIAGLSMGGYGALKLGIKYGSLFAFTGSLSGALRATQWGPDDLKGFPNLYDSLKKIFGEPGDPSRAANDPYELIKNAKGTLPYFYLDCGTSDILVSNSRDFVALLVANKIPYEYRELPGEHNWAYWDKQIKALLQVLEPVLQTK